jgi:hypothetical protein
VLVQGGGAVSTRRLAGNEACPNPPCNGVFLNTDPNALYYFGCDWKWRPMGGYVYFIVHGFQANESVNVSYEIFGLQGITYLTTLGADANGNLQMTVDMANAVHGHYHWHFDASSASYCGHFDY